MKIPKKIKIEIMTKIIPEYDKGTFICLYIIGQALPNKASGSPNEIKDKYIISNNRLILLSYIINN